MFRVSLSDGSPSIGFVRATNVLFGGMAILLFEDSFDDAMDAGSRVEIEQDRVLAFLLTWPDRWGTGQIDATASRVSGTCFV